MTGPARNLRTDCRLKEVFRAMIGVAIWEAAFDTGEVGQPSAMGLS